MSDNEGDGSGEDGSLEDFCASFHFCNDEKVILNCPTNVFEQATDRSM